MGITRATELTLDLEPFIHGSGELPELGGRSLVSLREWAARLQSGPSSAIQLARLPAALTCLGKDVRVVGAPWSLAALRLAWLWISAVRRSRRKNRYLCSVVYIP
jgi:hypothetical protein